MTIARLLASRPAATIVDCAADVSVREAIALLAERRIGAVPVRRDGAIVGIFSERDVIYQLAALGPALLDQPVCDVMTSPPITVDPATGVMEALALMTRRRIRHLPVLDGDRLAGFISIGDLVKFRIDAIESEAAALREYIQSA